MRFTVRIEDLGDQTGYVVMDNGEDVMTFKTRESADTAVAVLTEHGYDEVSATRLLLAYARDYALRAHGQQEHGSETIEDHLTIVSGVVSAMTDHPRGTFEYAVIMSAAWLHDVLEDTELTEKDINEWAVDEVVQLVVALTDGPGENRYERHLNTYWRIREAGPDAVLIKLADRYANQLRSIAYGEKYLDMYLGEYRYFKMALWRPGEHVKLWSMLDDQYKTMKGRANGEARLREGKPLAEPAGTGEAPDGAEQG